MELKEVREEFKEKRDEKKVDVGKLEKKRKIMVLQMRYVEASIRNLCSRVEDVDVLQELGPKFPLQGISVLLLEKKLLLAIELSNQRVRSKGRRTSIAWLRRASTMTALFLKPGMTKPDSSPLHNRHMAMSINSIKQQLFRSHFVASNASLSPVSSLDSMLSAAASIQFDLRAVMPLPSPHGVYVPEKVESYTPDFEQVEKIRVDLKKRNEQIRNITTGYKNLLEVKPKPKKRRTASYQSDLKPPLEHILGVRGIDRELHTLGVKLSKALSQEKVTKPPPLKQLYGELTKVKRRRREQAVRMTPSTAPTSPGNRLGANIFGAQLPTTNLSPDGLLARLRTTVQTLT